MISAITWQKKCRQKLGKIAQRWGWISEDDIAILLQERMKGERIGEMLLRHNIITPFQLRILLYRQKRNQKPLGTYLVSEKLLTEAEVERHIQYLHAHNSKYGNNVMNNR